LKPLVNIAILLFALAGIFGLSILRGVREKNQLLDQFTETNRQQVQASAAALGARLDELDHDVRLLIHVLEQSSQASAGDRESERRIFSGAFQALVVVIPQYRSIALYDAQGAVDLLVTHPTESRETIAALTPHNDRAARALRGSGARAQASPGVRVGDRDFLLYAVPVGDRTIVVTSDTAMFLGAVLWSPPTGTRLLVTDPSGAAWMGCGTPTGCSVHTPAKVREYLATRRSSTTRIGAAEAATLGWGASPALLASEQVARPTGTWTVSWLASTEAILARELSLQVRLMATSIAAALAVAAVGLMMLRQQRKAIDLEGSLHYAQALASARQTSESIVESAPLGVLGVSQEGRVVLANRFFSDRLGPVRIGAPLKEALTGEGAELVALLAPLLRKRGEPLPAPTFTKSRRFHIRVVPVQNRELGVSHFALVEDRSELRDLEHQLVRAEKLITVGVISAGIAHEVGSPLAVIRGRAQQVLRHLGEGPRAEDVRMIIKHIDNIASTIRQLLDFSRRQTIVHRAVPLSGVIERARGLLDWKLEARSLTMTSRLAAELPPLAADPDQLEQVLVNLLLNACDASAPGAGIEISAAPVAERRVRIEIADKGTGIAPEHMNAVFDPFFTTKKKGEGTGLGLSIVASIVRNHGGEIDLTSEPGVGTTVTLLWPASEERRHA
jgi:signal transduction histidine kinase